MKYRIPRLLPIVVTLLTCFSLSAQTQTIMLPCQTETDAFIGLDRKDFLGGNNSSSSSEGYLHNFTLPAMQPCAEITNVEIEITAFSSIVNPPGGCPVGPFFYNIFYGCGSTAPASCDQTTTLLGEPNTPTFTNQNFNYTQTPTGTTMDFGEIISVDIIPATSAGCAPDWQMLVSNGYVSLEYEICVTVTITDLTIGTPVDLGPDQDICTGDMVTLDAGSYDLYNWDPNGETTQTINVGAGTYTVTVTDANGCTSSDDVVVTQDAPTVSISSTEADLTVCPGSTTDLTAMHTGTSVLWSTGASTDMITIGPGNYDVTVTDANNCTATASMTINEHTPPSVTIDPASATVCDNTTTTISVVEGGLSYNWSTGETTQAITVGAGNYTVTVTDGNGCINTATTTVTSVSPPNAGSDATIDACNDGTTFDLFAELGGADGGGTWTDDDGTGINVNANPTATSFNGVFAGSYDFTYTVVGTPPCPDASATITVNVSESLSAGSSNFDQICPGETGYDLEALLGPSDGGGAWDDLDGSGVDLSDPTFVDFTGVPSGIYDFEYSHAASVNCPGSSAIVTIEILNAANAGADNSTTGCAGSVIDLFDLVSVDADLAGVFEDLSASGGLSGNEFNTATVGPGSYEVVYIVSTSGGTCPSDTAVFTIDVSTSVSAGLDSTYLHCDTSTLVLTTLLRDADLGGDIVAIGTTEGLSGDLLSTALLEPGTYSYWYIVGDGAVCPRDTALLEIEIEPVADLQLLPFSRTICTGTCTDVTLVNMGDSILMVQVLVFDEVGQVVDTITGDISTDTLVITVCSEDRPSGPPVVFLDSIFIQGETVCGISPIVPATVCPPLSPDTTFIEALEATLFELDTTLCATDTLVLGGDIFVGENVSLRDTLPGAACDSIIDINITINPVDTVIIRDTLCFEDTLTLGGILYTEANPSDTIMSTQQVGCDSLTIVDLVFRPAATETINSSLCGGDFIVVNGTTYDMTNPSGTETLATSNGCDSVITINLTFGTDVQQRFDDTLCTGESITIAGTVYDVNNPTDTLNIPGASCDTVVIIDLSFAPVVQDTVSGLFCSDYSITVDAITYDINNPTGTTILPSTVFPFCDSLVVVDLDFREPAESMFTETLCEGEEITIGTDTYSEGNTQGTTILPGAGAGGCDSTIMVSIDFSPTYDETVPVQICEGDSIEIAGVWQTMAGNYSDTLQSVDGCDSVVTTVLTVDNCTAQVNIVSQDIDCAGESTGRIILEVQSEIDGPFVIEIVGQNVASQTITLQSSPGNASFLDLPADTYQIAITDANGMVVFMSQATISQPSDPLTASASVTQPINCDVTTATIAATAMGGTPPYSYLWDDASTASERSGLSPGTYLVTVTDANDCSTMAEITVEDGSALEVTYSASDPLCETSFDGSITIENVVGGQAPYILTVDGQGLPATTADNLGPGSYLLEVTDQLGCVFQETIVLTATAPPLIEEFQENYTLSPGDSINLSFTLSPLVSQLALLGTADTTFCTTCSSFTVSPLTTTTYTVLALTPAGCNQQVLITVVVEEPRRSQANVFSPNGDGLNDDLVLYAPLSATATTLSVFDRWGNNVMTTTAADRIISWDGRNDGTAVNTGVYVYVLTWVTEAGVENQEVGNVTVIR